MALSKDEQRTLDEIERALRDEDPRFATTVNFDHLLRRRMILGGLTFLLGIVAMVIGEVASQAQLAVGVVVGVAGFVVMFTAVAWMLRRPSRR